MVLRWGYVGLCRGYVAITLELQWGFRVMSGCKSDKSDKVRSKLALYGHVLGKGRDLELM
jgi:hypothetical protein